MTKPLLMLDLACGLKGASQAMVTRGWQVITVDINPQLRPDIITDLTYWTYHGRRPDLIWASPPCDEFSREFMPWSKTGKEPSMEIVRACKRIIDTAAPRFWVIENVQGAIPWFLPEMGQYRAKAGPFYLWGFFPDIGLFQLAKRDKQTMSSRHAALRGETPASLSLRLAMAVESQAALL